MILGLVVFLVLGVFVGDVLTQRAAAVSVLYVVPVLTSLWCCPCRGTLLTAAAATVLTPLGFSLSEPSTPAWTGWFNISVAVLLIWVTGILGLAVRRSLRLAESHANLQQEMRERWEAEEHIREQAALLDQVPDAIVVRDLEGRIRCWNRGAERLYGWTAAEALGRGADELHFQKVGREVEEIQRAVLGKGEWSGELRQVTRDGKEITVEAHWVLLRDREGQPRAELVVNSDLTARKKLEAQLLRTQRLESIGTLVAGIAHDFNNLLTPIFMASKLLKHDHSEEERQNLLTTIRASAERGAEMVGQLLAFTGGLSSNRAIADPQAIIKENVTILQHTLPKKIQIRTVVQNCLHPIYADSTQVSQVLMNLCVNARDAMPHGGTLTLMADNATLDEDEARKYHPDAKPGTYVRITVADTGAGIEPDAIDKIFEPFFTTKEPGKGTGLGLSTALGIIKSHSGFITISSEVGAGSRFEVYLPVRREDESYSPERERVELAMGQRQLILLVDDERLIRETARKTLEAHGYRVLTAGDGREALSLYRDQRKEIGAVIVDMMMPVMDGIATIQALRELDPHVRVVATSGLHPTERVAAAGENAFLAKPFTDEQILAVLAKVLRAG